MSTNEKSEIPDYIGTSFLPVDKHDTYPAIDPAKADLTGKVVVITGASRGIGRATAVAMAQAGAKGIVLLARSDLSTTVAECLAAGRQGHQPELLTFAVDVTDVAQVAAAAKRIEETFGHVDILINNAGYLERPSSIAESDPEEWWRTFEINVRGTYAVTRALIPLLGGDKIVVNVTTGAVFAFVLQYSAYALSKLALLRFAEWVSVEYGGEGVIAHSIHPGLIATEMVKNLPAEILAAGFTDTVELAAHTLLWLVSERREWLSGRYIDSRWDVEALLEKRKEVVEGDKLKVTLAI